MGTCECGAPADSSCGLHCKECCTCNIGSNADDDDDDDMNEDEE